MKKLLFVLMAGTIVFATNPLFAMPEDQEGTFLKNPKRESSNSPIFKLSIEESSEKGKSSPEPTEDNLSLTNKNEGSSQEENQEDPNLRKQSADQSNSQGTIRRNEEREEPNHATSQSLPFSNEHLLKSAENKRDSNLPLTQEEWKILPKINIDQMFPFKK